MDISLETIELLEENIIGELPDIDIGIDFFEADTKRERNKSQNK